MSVVTELAVGGMDCASCAAHVRRALESVDGVLSADVRLAAERAVVTTAGPADRTALVEAVRSAGYEVREETAPAPPAKPRIAGLFGILAGVVLLVVVAGEWLGLFDALAARIPFPVGVALVVLIGWPAFRQVARATLSARVTSHTLMTVGVLAALVIGEWVTAAVVAFFMRFGDAVERYTMQKGRRALRDLSRLAPETARVEGNGGTAVVAADALRPGDIVVVRPGERIPADGVVLSGRAAVDQAAITGESVPVEMVAGSRVFASTIPRGGALRVRVERVGADATFGRILRMVEEAESNRGPVERFADRFSGWYLPVVAAVALGTWLVRRDPLASAAVLVVACSCAFAIATPMAMLASIGTAARRGLLIKGGAVLERLARVDVVLLDKTGTVTVGRPAVQAVIAHEGFDAAEVLRLAASAERDSEHPLAEAIRTEASHRGLAVTAPTSFQALEGAGVRAVVAGREVRVASERDAGPTHAGAGLREQGMTTVIVTLDGTAAGVIGLRDTLRPAVAAALGELRALGIERIELLTGDHAAAARPIAESLGIDCRADLLPEEKHAVVEEYQRQGHTVLMVGDGVNDAPALARADVGFAIAGTDLALEVAPIAALRDDWALVPDALRTARRTLRVVRGNFALTGLYNVVGLSLAALGILPPILAAAAQSIPDLGILGNSSRLLRGHHGANGTGAPGVIPSVPGNARLSGTVLPAPRMGGAHSVSASRTRPSGETAC